MIVRAWRGRAPVANPQAYIQHFKENVLPALSEIDGFLGASLLRADRPEEVEFLVLTRWVSMDSIRAFAGKDVRRAVVEPEAVAALRSFDPTVEHYTVEEEVMSPVPVAKPT